ncbi:hypothetical protein RHSIM_Rhsim01G0074900 [Rhododendron simsii]|uniref:Transposase-associated domain-containing protein n=1 Tax=Rhododendron simsii TaxID=118357 RepID=A0A834M173_RHOSS|nr:hypothetical protein RHSIM_Rhsim01G0074900 [Rhododendron simsii]
MSPSHLSPSRSSSSHSSSTFSSASAPIIHRHGWLSRLRLTGRFGIDGQDHDEAAAGAESPTSTSCLGAVFSLRTTTEIGAQSSLFKAEIALLLLLNRKYSFTVVKIHLIRNGFDTSYKTWVHHGESVPAPQAYDDDHHDPNEGIGDEIGGEVPKDGNQLQNMVEQVFIGGLLDDDSDELPANLGRGDVRSFDKLFNAAQRKIYPESEKSVLAFIVEMLHVKVYKKMPNDTFNIMMNIIKGMRPDYDEAIPWNTYEAKKFLRDLGLGYVPIHACINDCALFWKENENLENCPKCNEPRYKEWKNFDERFPDFAAEPRNVRLGMATDGFNPFGHMSQSYSMWPVIMVPYNLPPWKCMKEPFCFMSLLIPGPSSIGKDIDVYLRPLVDELKELWKNGVQTYDASTGKKFTMRACVFWTIHVSSNENFSLGKR